MWAWIRKGVRIALIVMTVMVCSGCLSTSAGTYFRWDDVRRLRLGMTIEEVEAIVGSPYTVVGTGPGQQRWIWSYGKASGESGSFTMSLRDGRVISLPSIPDSF